jgi:Polysaccharide lyase/Bacterial Ig domain
MKNQNVLCTNVYSKAKTMLFSGLLLATVFSCKKETNEFSPSEAVALEASQTSLVANPNLIYEETFEGSSYFPITGTTLNKTHAIENCNNNSTVTPATYDWTLGRRTSPVFQQSNSVRFEIRKGQPLVKSGTRSEVTIIKGTEDSRFTPEIWYSFAMLIPTEGGENDRRVSINQWFEDGSKETTLRTENGKCYLETASTIPTKRYDIFSTAVTSDETSASFANHPRDKWTEVVFHFIHSMGSDGLIEIFRDGVKIHTINGPNMHLELPKWKLGLYGAMDKSTLDSKVIYFDNIRVGKATATLADMSSTITTPPPTSNTPTTSITSPAANATFIAPATVTINATAADTDGTISSVAFYSGTTLLGTDNTSPYSYTWSNVAAGNYSLTSRATDNSGSVGTSAPVAITVNPNGDPTNSSITSFTLIDAGTDRDILTMTNGGTYNLTQLGVQKLSIRANSTASLSNITFVLSGAENKTYVDQVAPYSLHGDNGGNYYYGTWNPPTLGNYTLKATPMSGSVANAAATISFTFTNGTVTSPTNTNPIANAGSNSNITLPVNTVNLSGSASDADGSIATIAWSKVAGPSQFTFSSTNTLTPTVSNLTAGVYTFRLSVTDNLGATATDDVDVTVNNTVSGPSGGPISSFTLINAATDVDILTIVDGATYSLSQLGVSKLNIRANTDGTTGSVNFQLSGAESKNVNDKVAPFALMGDNGSGNYYYGTWNPPTLGSYTLKATPYVSTTASGTAGTASTIRFNITN